MRTKVEADFFNPKIQELPLSYLQEWFGSAYSTNGVAKDVWTYLLPRTLETLFANEEPDVCGIELSLKRFETGNPDNWSSKQWHVLDKFQRSYLESGFKSLDAWGGAHLDDVICMFRLGGWPLEALLEQVNAMPMSELTQRLWRDWCGDFGGFGTIRMTEFWEKSDKQTMSEFYTSDTLHAKMGSLALSDATDADIALKAADLLTIIEAST